VIADVLLQDDTLAAASLLAIVSRAFLSIAAGVMQNLCANVPDFSRFDCRNDRHARHGCRRNEKLLTVCL
jgi:hypothetical protein